MPLEPLEPRRLLSETCALGDADGNGIANSADFASLSANFSRRDANVVRNNGDFNGDHAVNALDFNALVAHFGASQTVEIAQATGGAFATSSEPRNISFASAIVAGHTIALLIAVRGEGSRALSVSDSARDAYVLERSFDEPSADITLQLYRCSSALGSASLTVGIAPAGDVAISATALELSTTSGFRIAGDIVTSMIGLDPEALPNTHFTPHAEGALLVNLTAQLSGEATPIAPPAGLTEFYESELSSDLPVCAAYRKAMPLAGADTRCTFGANVPFMSLAASFAAIAPAPAATGVQPDYRLDARDSVEFNGTVNRPIPDHATGTPAPTNGTTFDRFGGIDGATGYRVTAGEGSGIFADHHQAPSTILVAAMLSATAAESILGLNDPHNSAGGAISLMIDPAHNTIAHIKTSDGAVTVDDGNTGSGMGRSPVVYGVTLDGNTGRITINGFVVATVSLSGITELNSDSAMRILNAWSSGGDSNPASGQFYELRCFAQPLSLTDERDQVCQMAWPLGPPITKRFVQFAFDDASERMIVGESDDAVSWTNYRFTSYNPPKGAVRDVSAYYDSASGMYYLFHTASSRTTPQKFLSIGKCIDPRLCLPHGEIDLTAQLLSATSPWAPQPFVDLDGSLSILFMHSYNGNAIYRVPMIDLAQSTFGTAVRMQEASGSDPFLLAPGARGNPSGKYRYFGGVGIRYEDADSVDGPYGPRNYVTVNGSQEGPQILPMDDGAVRLYMFGNSGMVYRESLDGGNTFGAELALLGSNSFTGGPFEVGHGDIVDRRWLA